MKPSERYHEVTEDNKKGLSQSAKRRLRKKAQETKRATRGGGRHGDENWCDGAKVAVVTGDTKTDHSTSVLKAVRRLQEDGVAAPRRIMSEKTFGGNLITYVG